MSGGDGGEEGRVVYRFVSGPQQGQRGQGQRGYGTVPGNAEGRAEGRAEGGGSGTGVPPSYEQAVKGDNKTQT